MRSSNLVAERAVNVGLSVAIRIRGKQSRLYVCQFVTDKGHSCAGSVQVCTLCRQFLLIAPYGYIFKSQSNWVWGVLNIVTLHTLHKTRIPSLTAANALNALFPA